MIITEDNFKDYNIGTKAANLFTLLKAGINVPPLLCVTSSLDINDSLIEKFGDEDVSVRSSSGVEDSAEYSFAGQFNTILNVSPGDIREAAERVLSVPQSDSFRKYCANCKVDPDKVNITAIIQKMIRADISGVMFTANPQGILSEAVIVAGYGTGDNVVEDKVSTSAYYVSTGEKLYYSERQENSPVLSEKQIYSLIDTGKKIKEIFGSEMDIEYAIKDDIIYILQARAITTLNYTYPIVLDNSNIVESYPGITLPLTQDFIRQAYYGVFSSLVERIAGKKTAQRLDDTLRNMVDCANGRIYYRISNWYNVLLLLPFNKKIIPVWQEMLGVKNTTVTSDFKAGFLTHLRVSLSFVRLITACPGLMKGLDGFFGEVIADFEGVELSDLTNKEILSHYEKIKTTVTKKWDITLVNDMYSFLYTALLKNKLKKMKVQDYALAANSCISGITGIESLKPISALIDISKRKDTDILKDISSNEDFYRFLKTDTELSRILKEYIDRYGDRNLEELKLESKTFRTDPVLLVQRILQYREDNITLEKKPAPKSYGRGVERLSKKAALGIANREKSRLARARLYGMMRSMMLKIGERLTSEGRLSDRWDIFYLYFDEVKASAENNDSLKDLVRDRKEKYTALEKLPPFGRIVFCDRVFDKNPLSVYNMELKNPPDKLKGIPCSMGEVTGEALVIENPTAAIDTRDKILITKMTDPGWVFLIAGAKGVVAEKGSLLSHTAIISRELKKPSVVGVDNVTGLIKTGDIIRVNGGTGEITLVRRVQEIEQNNNSGI